MAAGATHDNMNRLLSQQPGGFELFRGTTNEPTRVTVQVLPGPAQQATTTPSNQFSSSAPVTAGQTEVIVQATDYASPPNFAMNTYRVTQSGSSRSFTYDPNGNLSSKTEGGTTTTYEWDAEDRLVTVKQGPTTVASFTYDGEGRRRSKFAGGITTTYIWAGQRVLQERSSFLADRRYLDGRGIDQHLAFVENGSPTYFLADHLGSVVRTTNGTGGPLLTRSYDPWGTGLQGVPTGGYAFTGREWDPEVGFYYYRARYYASSVGRFISADPAGLRGGRNRYRYVGNNPAALTDPSGLSPAGTDCPADDIDCWRKNNAAQVCKGSNWSVPALIPAELRSLMSSLCTPPDHASSWIFFQIGPPNVPPGAARADISDLAGDFEGRVQLCCKSKTSYGKCSHITNHGGASNLFMLCVCCHHCGGN